MSETIEIFTDTKEKLDAIIALFELDEKDYEEAIQLLIKSLKSKLCEER